MSRRNADPEPRYWPNALAPSPPPCMSKMQVSALGADGARSSHAASSSARAARPTLTENHHAGATRCVRIRTEVTIPKLPPPPRSAQNRSSFWLGARRAEPAVRRHDPERHDVVERQAPGAPGQPHAAAEQEPAERHGRARPVRDVDAAPGEPGGDLDQRRAGPDRGDPAARQPHAVEPAEVDHDLRVAGRAAVVGVAAGARHERHVVAVGPVDDRDDVRRVGDLHDGRRADPVVALVVDRAGRRVAAIAGREHPPAHGAAQRAQAVRRQRRGRGVAGVQDRQPGG